MLGKQKYQHTGTKLHHIGKYLVFTQKLYFRAVLQCVLEALYNLTFLVRQGIARMYFHAYNQTRDGQIHMIHLDTVMAPKLCEQYTL
jgi:hypothetical protein